MKMKRIRLICLCCLMGILFFLSENQEVRAEDNLKIIVKNQTKVKLTGYKKVKVKVYYNGEDVTKKTEISFKSSNKSIVKTRNWENDDFETVGFEAWLCKVGKCSIRIKAKYCPAECDDEYDEMDEYEGIDNTVDEHKDTTLSCSKVCNVKVEYYKSIRAQADVVGYNTRSNIFTIKVKNISNKSIRVLSNKAYAFDDDYKSFDRRLKVIKGSVIKPGKTVKVKFKVLGSVTWYNEQDFQICSYWKWGGKKYWVTVMPGEETWRKSGKKWVWIGFAR